MVEPEFKYEPVHTVVDYWSGPRSGVAGYRGRPHWFACIFDETRDDYSDFYYLTPLDGETLELIEQWSNMFFRWLEQSVRGEATTASHPLLSNDIYKKLDFTIQGRIEHLASKRFKIKGKFRVTGPSKYRGYDTFEVQWTEAEAGSIKGDVK